MRLRLALSASCLIAAAGSAAADVTLSGTARLGLGYNIDNEGTPMVEATRSVEVPSGEGPRRVVTRLGKADDLRAVSRIRFVFTGVGETDSGISYGASIRADNASSGGTGDSAATGQTGGDVFVSGAWGTLVFGDTAGADYARVGDPIGNVSLTGLGDWNELPFVSNGGGADNDELQFVRDPAARPTVRYDYDAGDFGVSVSTDRKLNSVGVGASYQRDFGDDAEVSVGVGYYDFSAFTGTIEYFDEVDFPDGHEWSASLTGAFGNLRAGAGYASIDAGSAGALDVLNLGLGATFGAWTAMTYYSAVLSGDDLFGEALDGKNSYGASLDYDLGGNAHVRMGLARSYGADAIGAPEDAQYAPAIDAATIADFGIAMAF